MTFRSTLPREERRSPFRPRRRCRCFDPRSRVRSDSPARCRASGCRRFDPRSRVRSDRTSAALAAARLRFDPRSRVRSDRGAALIARVIAQFRSTLPREERPLPASRRRSSTCFDPRSRVRSDAPTSRSSPPRPCFDPRSRVRSERPIAARTGSRPCAISLSGRYPGQKLPFCQRVAASANRPAQADTIEVRAPGSDDQ